jgi:hypothetical protein
MSYIVYNKVTRDIFFNERNRHGFRRIYRRSFNNIIHDKNGKKTDDAARTSSKRDWNGRLYIIHTHTHTHTHT